ncbi:hypothetical protein C8R41DRAFT_846454 [Lentinula lateritia]|uniref:Secreted protein n=1 Tax=Lentinula lateritia TaxID=40482 RepID=A0ABQ8V820_9AGAR|nr:hypothetical protein C8R41DRAFT_846454 [Lentinula lateritia]
MQWVGFIVIIMALIALASKSKVAVRKSWSAILKIFYEVQSTAGSGILCFHPTAILPKCGSIEMGKKNLSPQVLV